MSDPLGEIRLIRKYQFQGYYYAGLVGMGLGPLLSYGGFKLFQLMQSRPLPVRFGTFAGYCCSMVLFVKGVCVGLGGAATVITYHTL
jgi:hypothetical protein